MKRHIASQQASGNRVNEELERRHGVQYASRAMCRQPNGEGPARETSKPAIHPDFAKREPAMAAARATNGQRPIMAANRGLYTEASAVLSFP